MAKKNEKAKIAYKVTPGHSFTGGGIVYGPGSDIPESCFPSAAVIEKLVKNGSLVEATITEAAETDKTGATGTGSTPGAGDGTGTEDAGAGGGIV